MKVRGLSCRIQLHVKHLFGNCAAIAILQHARVLNSVLQIEDHPRYRARIALVHQNCAATQKVTVAVERQVKRRIQQRMTGANIASATTAPR